MLLKQKSDCVNSLLKTFKAFSITPESNPNSILGPMKPGTTGHATSLLFEPQLFHPHTQQAQPTLVSSIGNMLSPDVWHVGVLPPS